MKKAISTLLAFVCLLGLLGVPAFAADAAVAGVYNLTTVSGYTLTPQDAKGTELEAKNVTIDGKTEPLYEGAERFALRGTSGTEGYYLVLMLKGEEKLPKEENIWYIDQDSPGGSNVTFDIYPMDMQKGDYKIYISQSGGTGLTEVASFSYAQPYTLGDVNNDKKINSSDALMVLQNAVTKIVLTDSQKLAADVNKDKKVNSSDALKILQYAVGKIQSFD